MRVYVVTFSDGRKRAYTSRAAMYEDNTAEELGVSKFTLNRFPFDSDAYKNSQCTIDCIELKRASDIKKEKEQFL